MKRKFRIELYLIVFMLFLCLYILNFREDLSYTNIKLCIYSSIVPALVGGTVGNLLFK